MRNNLVFYMIEEDLLILAPYGSYTYWAFRTYPNLYLNLGEL